MRSLLRVSIVVAAAAWASVALPQASFESTDLLEVFSASQDDPEAAVALIDGLMAGQPPTDPRTLFDLLLLKASLLTDLDRPEPAAQLYLELAEFAGRNRDVLNWDPAVLLNRAIAEFVRATLYPEAEATFLLIVGEQQDGGASGAEIAATLDRLAAMWRMAGNTVAADKFTAQAQITRDAPEPSRSAGEAGGFREVEVFYATDRARSGDPSAAEFYGHDRGDLEMGIAIVTIPDRHESGVVEAPSIWRLEFGPNPARHVVLQSVTPVDPDGFFEAMNSRLTDLGSTEAFVFVHGYNVRFDAAAKRAAQMAYDMNFPGVPILYSWPSRGSTVAYIPDTAVVQLSGRRLSRFLDDLVERSGATTIHIVAHSMGNRALTDALELLALRRGIGPDSEPVFGQVLFAAPDVDADLFAEMMPVIRPVARRLTLYASEKDWALATSRQLHGDAPRAGQGGESMVSHPDFDSVDMSELGEDMLAHSYFADDSSAIADMVALFWRNANPDQRCGLQPNQRDGAIIPIWEYRAGSCEDQALVEVMAHLRNANVTDPAMAMRIVSETVDDAQMARTLSPIVVKMLSAP
jgi:esterase/lipase superfamily enzyme